MPRPLGQNKDSRFSLSLNMTGSMRSLAGLCGLARTWLAGYTFGRFKDQTENLIERPVVFHRISRENVRRWSQRQVLTSRSQIKNENCGGQNYGTQPKRQHSASEERRQPEPAQPATTRRVDDSGCSASEWRVCRRD